MSTDAELRAEYQRLLNQLDRAPPEKLGMIPVPDPRDATIVALTQQLASAREDAWAPVSERLPSDDRNVLSFGSGDCIEAYCEDGYWYSSQHDGLLDVTHWQPLPPPPIDSKETK